MIEDQHERHQTENCRYVDSNEGLEESTQKNDVCEEDRDIKNGVLALVACEDNQFVGFVVVNDGVEPSDDSGISDEEETGIDRVVVNLCGIVQVRKLNVEAEDHLHHRCYDQNGEEPVENHVKEIFPVFDVLPNVFELLLNVLEIGLIFLFGLILSFLIVFVLELRLVFGFVFLLVFVFFLLFLLNFLELPLVMFEPSYINKNDCHDKYN